MNAKGFSLTIFLLLTVPLFPAEVFASVLINEIAWMGSPPQEGETSSQAANDEWIELYNSGNTDVTITDWQIEATDGAPTIKLKGIIPANGYFLLSRANSSVNGIPADFVYPFKGNALSNDGEDLRLIDAEGNLVDRVNASSKWPAGDNTSKRTMERTNLGWQTSENPGGTPKAQNSTVANEQSQQPITFFYEPTTTTEKTSSNNTADAKEENKKVSGNQQAQDKNQEMNASSTPLASPSNQIVYPDKILINELLPSPDGPDQEEEWVEIFNPNGTQIDIANWTISDTVGTVHAYTFPKGSTIEAQGFLVISRPQSGIALNNGGDKVQLKNPTGVLVDEISYGKAPSGMAFARKGTQWIWTNPTPGAPNAISDAREDKKEKEQKNPPPLASVASQHEEGNINTTKFPFDTFLLPLLSALTLAFFGGITVILLKHKMNRS
jgi:hypothetical protein